MKMNLKRIKKAILNPGLVKNYLGTKASLAPYYIGTGSGTLYPKTVFISVNNVCNAKCVMCDVGLKNKDSSFYQNLIQDRGNSLPFETLKKFLSEIGEGKPKVCINSTEPLLCKDILHIIELIKSKELFLELTTNGILLSRFAKDLIDLGLDVINISIDGLEDVHDNIRGKGVFKKAINGIEQILRYRGQFSKPIIRINCTITTLNTTGLFDFADFMINKLGVNMLSFSQLNFVNDDMASEHNRKFSHLAKTTSASIKVVNPAMVDIAALWSEILKIKKNLDCSRILFIPEISNELVLYKYYNQPDYIISRDRCMVPWFSTTLQPNGDIIILHRCFPYKAGNINESSFKDIWHGEQYKKIRMELKKNKLFPACTRCCGVL